MLNPGLYTWSAVIFIIIVALLLFRDRKNVRREQGIFFLRRTQRGRRFLLRLGNSHPLFWKQLGNLAILVGFVMSVWFTWMMFAQLPLIASGAVPKEASGGILLPSLTDQATLGRGFILVPFWYWIIALSVILFSHEGMHAMLGVAARVKLKSIGWGLMAVLPLGFVEPDERQVSKRKPVEQLRFFAAGSFGNFVVAGASLLILMFAFNPMFANNGVAYRAVAIGYPAEQANMTGYIIGISSGPNSYAINSTDDMSNVLTLIGPNRSVVVTTINATANGAEELRFALTTAPEPEPQFKPGALTAFLASLEHFIPGIIDFAESPPWAPQPVTWASIKYDIGMWAYLGGNYPALEERALDRINALQAELALHPQRGYLGIAYVGNVQGLKPEFAAYDESIMFFGGLFYWLFLLDFGVGAFNLLPMKPLDGERLWRLVVQKILQRRRKKGFRPMLHKDRSAEQASRIMNYVSIVILFLILAFFALVVM
ncbi:MAG: hypothetical protein FJY76_01920 [Candidatus Aenigmarchaeota archaeon]|nr:hypothetical protein [Candidatus Aenigmarchaeota archaeon]